MENKPITQAEQNLVENLYSLIRNELYPEELIIVQDKEVQSVMRSLELLRHKVMYSLGEFMVERGIIDNEEWANIKEVNIISN